MFEKLKISGVARQVRPGIIGAWTAGQRLDPAAGYLPLALPVNPQGSRALFNDRGDSIVAVRPAAVRAESGARRAVG